MTRDPIGTAKKIYAHFEMDLPYALLVLEILLRFHRENEVASMQKWLTDNPQGKHGRRPYTPEMYGLTANGIRKEFREYIEVFCAHH